MVVQLVRAPACHAGSCEFESRPPRKNPQELISEGFSLHETPRQITHLLFASVNNQKQGLSVRLNMLLVDSPDQITDQTRQMEKQNEDKIHKQNK